MLKPSDILSDDGPLADLIDDFVARPLQQEMSETIMDAIINSESLVCEAGTGTGKTFAYLVPALLSGLKVLISTGTKHLQDQLYHRDLPTVLMAVNAKTSTALLKGRSNYLCIQRHRFAGDIVKSPALHTELFAMSDWAQQTETGDLTEILPESSVIRPWVSSTVENCVGQECEHYDNCFVLKARKRAAQADVIIVNHHLLMADMALRETGFGELLPNIDVIIFDEAHQLPDLASQFFGINFSSRQCLDLSNDTRTAYQNEAWDVEGFMDVSYKLDAAVRELRSKFLTNEQKVEWQIIISDIAIKQSLDQLCDTLKEHSDLIEKISDRGKELDSCYKRNLQLHQCLNSFLDQEDNSFVQWLEVRGKGFLLHKTPLNIAEEFQNRLKHYQCSTVFTSATLAVGKKFIHFSSQLGLEEAYEKQWPSPFDYQTQTLLYLPEKMPLPSEQNYTEEVIERSIPLLKASQGRAFLLFTSHRALKLAAKLISTQLDYPCFVQGDVAKTELLERFRHSKNGLLLGTSSFWEGVDVKGSALSCVIIDKLPFAMPDDPVLKARGTMMREQGKNVFMEYQLPQAVIALKQGVGRLIRDANDYGVLMICDPRLRSKSYGRIFLNSLPDMTQTNCLSHINEFYEKFSSM